MTISTILCTHNRGGLLERAVTSVYAAAKASGAEVELVLVDNASTDATFSIAQALAKDAPIRVIVLQEPRKGVCRAKNLGIQSARGDVLTFTDDDCVLSETYYRDLLAHYAHDQGPVVRGGRVELGDPTDMPFTIKTEDVRSRYDGIMHPGGFIHGCNLSCNRAVIDAIGGFDERFGPGGLFEAAEDTEFLYRAHRAGIVVEYVPDMAVSHFHGRKRQDDIVRLSRGYHIGNGALYAKSGFGDRLLRRHLYWNVRNWLLEYFGGKKFDPAVGLSHKHLVFPQFVGMARYLGHARPPRELRS